MITQNSKKHNGKLVKITKQVKDPLEPSRARRHKEVVLAQETVPVHHAPAKRLSKAEKEEWQVPVCVSGYKNKKSFMRSLAVISATQGREDSTEVSDKHLENAQELQKATEEIHQSLEARAARKRVQAEKERAAKEAELKARAAELAGAIGDVTGGSTRPGRGGRTGTRARDESERAALGLKPTGATSEFGASLYLRDAPQKQGTDDATFKLYDAPLFGAQAARKLYSASDGAWDASSEARAGTAFKGSDAGGEGARRARPVEFTKSGLEHKRGAP